MKQFSDVLFKRYLASQHKMAKLNGSGPSEDFILLLQTSAPSATGMNSSSNGEFGFLKIRTDI